MLEINSPVVISVCDFQTFIRGYAFTEVSELFPIKSQFNKDFYFGWLSLSIFIVQVYNHYSIVLIIATAQETWNIAFHISMNYFFYGVLKIL